MKYIRVRKRNVYDVGDPEGLFESQAAISCVVVGVYPDGVELLQGKEEVKEDNVKILRLLFSATYVHLQYNVYYIK